MFAKIHAAVPTIRDSDVVGVLDIGSTKISCVIACVTSKGDGPQVEIIGAAHQASGVHTRSGLIETGAEPVLHQVIQRAEKMAGHRLSSVHVAVPGQHLNCRRLLVEIATALHPVEGEDIAACLKEGRRQARQRGMVPLHVWPTSFSLDDADHIKDPRGLRAQYLRTALTAISAPETILHNIRDTLGRCHIEVASFIASPYASALGSVLEDERQLGVLAIDIGGHQSSYSVYDDGKLLALGALPVAGAHVTRDIARAFSISLAAAERLKIRHAEATISPISVGRVVDVPPSDSTQQPESIACEHLCEVVEARLEEICTLVQASLVNTGVEMRGIRRVVLTGGSCQFPGIVGLVSHALKMTPRIGRPRAIYGAPEVICEPGFSVAAGMLESLTLPVITDLTRRRSLSRLACDLVGEAPAGSVDQFANISRIQQVVNWVRSNF